MARDSSWSPEPIWSDGGGPAANSRAAHKASIIYRRTLGTRAASVGRLEVPFTYAEDGHVTHAYATTVHKAQGVTADRALVMVDETMWKEHLYTALSRGRDRRDLYLPTGERWAEPPHAVAPEAGSFLAIAGLAARRSNQDLALDDVSRLSR